MNSNNQTEPEDLPSIQKDEEALDPKNSTTQSTSATTDDIPEFGWSGYAERINGRFAMIGFIAILLIEAFTQDSFLHWSGIIPF